MIIDEQNNNIFIIEKLNSLKNALNKDTVNLNEIKHKMDSFNEYSNANMYEYLNSLLDPIRGKGAKIPSNKVTPTCSFQLHNYLTFGIYATNGCNVFGLNPWFLASEKCLNRKYTVVNEEPTREVITTENAGAYFYCYASSAIGNESNPYWGFPKTFSQIIPDVYDKYRVVSACLTVRYIGELDAAQGVIGGGISYTKSNVIGIRLKDPPPSTGSGSTTNFSYNQFANFELIRDCYYHTENNIYEGLKMLYFPLDNSFEEFKKVYDGEKANVYVRDGEKFGPDYELRVSEDYFKPGFNWMVYLQGVPKVSTPHIFKVDFYINYECIPKAEFLNYMPITINLCHITDEMKRKFLKEVMGRSISALK